MTSHSAPQPTPSPTPSGVPGPRRSRYTQLVAWCKSKGEPGSGGWPTHFRADLIESARAQIAHTPVGTPWGVALRETGLDMFAANSVPDYEWCDVTRRSNSAFAWYSVETGFIEVSAEELLAHLGLTLDIPALLAAWTAAEADVARLGAMFFRSVEQDVEYQEAREKASRLKRRHQVAVDAVSSARAYFNLPDPEEEAE